MSFQQRAVLMSERVLGIDNPNTITEYVSHLKILLFEEIHTSSSDSLLLVYLYFISVILSLLGPPCPLLFCQQSSVQCTAVDIQDTVLSLTLPRRGSSRGGFNRCK